MSYKLRPHQKEQNKAVRKALKEHSHVIYSASTGWGKSICIWDFAKRALGKGQRVLILAPTRKLVLQLTETLHPLKPVMFLGSVVKGDRKSNLIISSRQTSANRLKINHKAFQNFDLIIIDEVHISGAMPPKKGSQFEILYNTHWGSANWVGFSGTPICSRGYRINGWDKTISLYQTGELIDMGFLSDYDFFAPERIDLTKLTVSSMGEYTNESMDEVVLKSTAIKSIKKQWGKYKDTRKIIIFASNIRHAELLQESLGSDVDIVHSKLTEKQVDEVLGRFEKAKTATIVNVGMLTVGFDSPSVDCLILARPIKSVALALQIYGRALRLYKNKRALILDMCNVYENCGLPRQIRDFNMKKPEKGEPREEIEDKTTSCPDCHRVFKMTERKVVEKVKKKYTLTKYYCPLCNSLLDEVRVDLSVVNKLVRVEEIVVVTLSGSERSELISRLVREQTTYKPAVIKFIGKAFKDKNAFGLFDEIVAELKHDEAKLWRKIWRTKQRLEKTDDNNK